MATSSVIKKDVTFTFGGDYTRKVTMSNFKPENDAIPDADVTAFRNSIKAFNDSDVSLVSAFYGYTTSDDSQTVHPVTGIKDANVTLTRKTPIYARDEEALARALATDTEGE